MSAVTPMVPGGARRMSPQEAERWLARRRWSRAGLVYLLMLIFSLVFLGPLLFATISSLKTDPLAYPPTLAPPQLSPANWAAGASLGRQGANAPLWGGFAPGAEVSFELTYFAPQGVEPEAPSVIVPRRRPGAGLGRAALSGSVSGVRRRWRPVVHPVQQSLLYPAGGGLGRHLRPDGDDALGGQGVAAGDRIGNAGTVDRHRGRGPPALWRFHQQDAQRHDKQQDDDAG